MRDRRTQRAFLALIFAIPVFIVLATSVSTQSVLELLVVEVIVTFGLLFTLWAKAQSRRPKVAVPIRVAAIPPRPNRSVRTVT
jgi:hypothetical protein